jgi:hypothetical protein
VKEIYPPKKACSFKRLDSLFRYFPQQSSLELQQSLRTLERHVTPAEFQVVQLLLMGPMQVAQYFCTGDCSEDQFVHFALNVPYYTHFTSPIRSGKAKKRRKKRKQKRRKERFLKKATVCAIKAGEVFLYYSCLVVS